MGQKESVLATEPIQRLIEIRPHFISRRNRLRNKRKATAQTRWRKQIGNTQRRNRRDDEKIQITKVFSDKFVVPAPSAPRTIYGNGDSALVPRSW
jgi:hypothetical protein